MTNLWLELFIRGFQGGTVRETEYRKESERTDGRERTQETDCIRRAVATETIVPKTTADLSVYAAPGNRRGNVNPREPGVLSSEWGCEKKHVSGDEIK